ncbi:MAG: tetratricopeptide repeat protein [Candidatus Omnitrophica bacterium]|nr:tetratricopeptide repeat protein [Candidatus Omnitrophota bacterium]
MGAFLTFRKFSLLFTVIGAVVIFFLSYNTYLIDHSLNDLKFVLEQTSRAKDVSETERLGLLLDEVLIQEVSALSPDSSDAPTLEFTKNVFVKGGLKRQLHDAEFLLNKVIKNREKKRGSLMLAFDRMNDDIQKVVRFITRQLPAGALRPEMFKPSMEIDLSLLDTAKGYEQDWQLKEAISAYEEFINRYPTYPQLRVVKLHLADSYFKSLNYREAERLYTRIMNEFPQSEEAKVAGVLLAKIKEKTKKRASEKRLINSAARLAKSSELASDYSELGLVDAYLEKLTKEAKETALYILSGAKIAEKGRMPGIDTRIIEQAKDFEEKWRLKDAQAMYEKFISSYPDYENMAYVKLLLGGVYLKSMQYEKAVIVYDNIVNRYPEAKEAALAKEMLSKTKDILLASQKKQDLMERIAQVKTAPDLANMYYNLALLDVYVYDLKGAETAFKKVMELAPGTEVANKAEFMLAWSYKFGARYDEGAAAFSAFAQKRAEHRLATDSAYHLADTYYKWGKYDEAAKGYESCADNFVYSPISEVALLQAGYTYLYNLRDPLKASEVFKKLKARYPDTDTSRFVLTNIVPTVDKSFRDYGFILLKQGKLQEAKDVFEKAISIDRNDAWAHSGFGTACTLLILLDKGVESTSEGLKLMKDEYTHAALGFSYDKKGEFRKAAEEYKASISKNSNYVVSHYNLARDYIIIGWYDLSARELNEALRILPAFAEAYNNLGIAYWYKGQLVDAEDSFKKAVSLSANFAFAHYNLGLLYEASERYQMAFDCFKKALLAMPEHESARRHLERARGMVSND